MRYKNNADKKDFITFFSVFLFLIALIGISSASCSYIANNQTSNSNSNNGISDNSHLSNENESSDSLSSDSLNNSSNNNSSINSSTGNIEFPPEPVIDSKNRTFNFTKEITAPMIEDLFSRIFKDVQLEFETNFEDDIYLIIGEEKEFLCPYCSFYNTFDYILSSKGVLEFNFSDYCGHNELYASTKFTLNLASYYAEYINKDDAVLVGGNNQNEFGVIKKDRFYYFAFMGLNFPLFPYGTNLYIEHLLASVPLSVKAYYYNDDEVQCNNAIPLMFFKNFADLCVDYELTQASENIVKKANEDALNGSFDRNILYYNYVNEQYNNINEIISYLKSSSYFVGNAKQKNDSLFLSLYSAGFAISHCYTDLFLEENYNFEETKDIYLYDGVLQLTNGSQGEYGGAIEFDFDNNFFPFFNRFDYIIYKHSGSGHFPWGTLLTADSLGVIATYGMTESNGVTAMYINDDSYDVDFSQYFYTWSVTDAYYYELEYYINHFALKSSKLLYAETYKDLTMPRYNIGDDVYIDYSMANVNNYVVLYGRIPADKVNNYEVVQCGFEYKFNNNISKIVFTGRYSSWINVSGEHIEDSAYLYFNGTIYGLIYDNFDIEEVRFFVEYKDHYEYSQWVDFVLPSVEE